MDNNQPVIIISAKDASSVQKIMADILDIPQVKNYDEEPLKEQIWHIENKYYSVDVRLVPVTDGHKLPCDPQHVEAHVIYLTEQECECEEAVTRRAEGVSECAAEVLVVGAECGAEAEAAAVEAAARRAGYEVVALREEGTAGAAAEGARGAARVREALQAHAWPGLRRAGPAAAQAPAPDAEMAAVARAEQFLEALEALGAARDAAAHLPTSQRRANAESLLEAFCHALGQSLYEL